jgi:N-acyl-D-aspartate/D-glutamate deacylase
MAMTYDLVIRGGTVIDGSGNAPFEVDVSINGSRITAVGKVEGRGKTEVDAQSRIVTPGFVDIHTHYDGQVVWSSTLSPSSHLGVTTIVIGNCGVGFAPCRWSDHGRLIELMEGVEDIPEAVMTEGLTWEWETFPQYLDLLGRRCFDVDVAAQLPHSALRLYVMGKRAVARMPSTSEDNERMAVLVREAMLAGATGFGTSRTLFHRTGSGEEVPTYGATEAELVAITRGMSDAGHGVFQLVIDTSELDREFPLIRNVARSSGRPISLAMVQLHEIPTVYQRVLQEIARAREEGLMISSQVSPRPQAILMGLQLTCHPFSCCPSYRPFDALPLAEKVRTLRDPEVRKRIVSEAPGEPPSQALRRMASRVRHFDFMFALGNPPNYAPTRDMAFDRLARKRGMTPEELAYDTILERDGKGVIYMPFANFADYTMSAVREMITDPNSIIALGDGGAHQGSLCDSPYPTFTLKYWTREGLALPWVVRAMTSVPAGEVALYDRGLIAPGYKADINVIDYDRLVLHAPKVVYDLPAGGRRLIQEASGFDATILSGVITNRKDQATGSLPGRLQRGLQPPPATPAAYSA